MQFENSSAGSEVEIELREPAAYLGRIKYTPVQSLKYQNRDPRKHRTEMALIRKAFAGIPTDHRVLDVPCGGGRAALELARQGYRVLAGDLSESMRLGSGLRVWPVARASTTAGSANVPGARKESYGSKEPPKSVA